MRLAEWNVPAGNKRRRAVYPMTRHQATDERVLSLTRPVHATNIRASAYAESASPSSSGLGHRPFTAGTGVRTP